MHLLLLLLFSSCLRYAEPETFLIPDNYEGAIVILFEQEDGLEEEYKDDRRVYRISQNGILKTKFQKTRPAILDQKYFYVDRSGKITRELHPYNSGVSEAKAN